MIGCTLQRWEGSPPFFFWLLSCNVDWLLRGDGYVAVHCGGKKALVSAAFDSGPEGREDMREGKREGRLDGGHRSAFGQHVRLRRRL